MDLIFYNPNSNSYVAAKHVRYVSYNFTSLHQISAFDILLIKSNDYFLTTPERRQPKAKRGTKHENEFDDTRRNQKFSNWVSASHTIEIRIWRAIMFTWSGLLLIYGFSVILKKRRLSPTRSFAAPRPSFLSRHQSVRARPLTIFLSFLVGERRTCNLCLVILSFLFQILSALVLVVVPSGSPYQSLWLRTSILRKRKRGQRMQVLSWGQGNILSWLIFIGGGYQRRGGKPRRRGRGISILLSPSEFLKWFQLSLERTLWQPLSLHWRLIWMYCGGVLWPPSVGAGPQVKYLNPSYHFCPPVLMCNLNTCYTLPSHFCYRTLYSGKLSKAYPARRNQKNKEDHSDSYKVSAEATRTFQH